MIRLFDRHGRCMRLLLAVVFLATTLVGILGANAIAQASPTTTQAGTPLPPAGPVIVALRNDTVTAASDFVAASGIEPTQVYTSAINGFAADVSAATIRDLAQNPLVANIIADTPVSQFAQYTPTQVKRTGINKYPPAAIDGIENTIDVDIAFLDGGIDRNHPDLNVAGGFSCVSGTDPFFDPSSHGTHTAGIAAARDNDYGVVGAAPGARIWSIKVFDDNGVSNQSTVLCGLDWIINSGSGIDVVNLSIGNNSGSTAVSACFSQVDPLHDAICSINAAGIPIVVAAGNMTTNANTYNYAKFPETISVAAIADFNGWPGGGAADICGYNDGSDDSFTNFSNFGAVVDIAAPGSCVFSTVPGGYEYGKGTSMAAPLVAGAVALYLSQQPGASPTQVRTWLLSDAASKQRTTAVGYSGGSTGTNRILYLGNIPPTTYQPGAINPSFAGSKLTIVGSIDAPVTDRSPSVYDGNPVTKWYSPATSPLSAQIRLDLGADFKISGVKWKFDYIGYTDEFTIRLFDGNGASKSYGPFGNATQANTFFGQVVSESQSFRYVEFFFENRRNLPSIGSVSEIEIWGSEPVPNPAGAQSPAFRGTALAIVTSSDTPATGRSGYAHDHNPGSKWYSNPTAPTSAILRFDLGSDVEITGIKWQFDYIGYADSFTVRIVNASGGSRTFGPFGNATQANTFFGQVMDYYTVIRYVEFDFANPRGRPSIGSISEVEIWGIAAPPLPPGIINPSFTGQSLPIVTSSDSGQTGRSGYAHDGNSGSKWYTDANTPSSATLRFDLGGDLEITGIKWKFDYVGYADEFTVRIVNSQGGSRVYGPFGNATQANTFFGQVEVNYTVIRYVEFVFVNPKQLSAVGSLSEVEIWGPLPTQPIYPPGLVNPVFDGTPLPIVTSSDAPATGRSGYSHDNNSGSKWYTDATSPTSVTLRFDLGIDQTISGIKWKFDYVSFADEFTVKTIDSSGVSQTYGPFGNATRADTFFGLMVSNLTPGRYVEFVFANPRGLVSIGSISEVEIWGLDTPLSAAVEASPVASPEPSDIEIPAASPLPATATTEPTDVVEPTVEPTAAISLGTITGTDGDSVNCRTTAPDGDPITQLNEGDEIEITGAVTDGWYPVICAGEAGFIAEQFITLGTSTPTEEGEESPTVEDTTEATTESTEEAVAEETPYPIMDTGDTENSGTAWLANDNDATTWWSLYPSQSPEQARLYLDLGSVLPIDRLTLELATWDQLPTFEIWLSEDGETWYNATPGGINGWNLDRETPVTISLGYDARFIRLVIPHVDESGLGEVGGIGQIDVWAGDSNQTQYLTSLGEPTTPTPVPAEPTEEVIEEPTEEIVEPTEVIEEPTEEVIPTDVPPTEEASTEEVPTEEPSG